MKPSPETNSPHQPPIQTAAVAESSRSWQTQAMKWGAILAGLVVLFVVACTAAYYLGTRHAGESPQASTAGAKKVKWWICSMHPQVKLKKPGICPLCPMELIPLVETAGGSGHPRELVMSPAAVALAEIETTLVRRQFVTNTIRMFGKVDYDETKLAYITAWVPGRLDRMFIDYTGVTVRKGDHLVEMYSPDLVVAQRELIQAWTNYQKFGRERSDDLLLRTLKSTEEKLRLLGVTEKQIATIKQSGKPSDRMTIYAPTGGVVIHKNANEGMYVQTGTRLYTIADLSQVWVYMNAYESDLPWLRYGQQVEFTTEAYAGEIFKGRIAFIDDVLNQKTRTARVRVNISNEDRRLKPGMFVRAIVKSRLAEGGQVIDEAMAGKWISPHHPEIVRDGPGKCPICGIDLVPAETLGFIKADAGAKPPLVIPATAPLITGKRAVVYLRMPNTKQPTFQGRDVLLGQRAGDYYIVRHGLSAGEEVVTHGNFKIDADLQIAGKVSMMSPAAKTTGGGPHTHHAGHTMAAIEIPAKFRVELSPTYQAYLSASEALAQDDLKTSREALGQLLKAIKQTDTKLLDADGRSRWKTVSDAIIIAAEESLDASGRAAVRGQFQHLSAAMVSLTQTFGHALSHPVYQFHCPMAFDNQGAEWLQIGKKTRNPYFGPEMLSCGDPMATFHPRVPLVVSDSFRSELEAVYGQYLTLQSKLAADDANGAITSIGVLRKAIGAIDAGTLGDRERQAWRLARKQMTDALGGDLDGMKIGTLRERFEPLSITILGVVDNFGHSRDALFYKAFCPMAFDGKGAAWLQASEKIANPYFGSKMLGCGDIQRTYKASTIARKP